MIGGEELRLLEVSFLLMGETGLKSRLDLIFFPLRTKISFPN